jgi:hypothetical protein
LKRKKAGVTLFTYGKIYGLCVYLANRGKKKQYK